MVAAGQKVHAIAKAIAIHVGRCQSRVREMEAALRAEDGAYFTFPRQARHPVQQESVVEGEI